MVATSGDESFVMLSMMHEKALLVFVLLFFIGLAVGYLTDTFFAEKTSLQPFENMDYCALLSGFF